jgi:hypothetical protein
MIAYNANVMYEFARRLEGKARFVTWYSSIAGGAIGCLVALIFAAHPGMGGEEYGLGVLGLIAGALAGYIPGSEWAFRIRIAMHTVLCQVQIEENTRAFSSQAAPLETVAGMSLK